MSNDDKVNVTSHNQSGGITAHTVNIGSGPRQMTDDFGREILQQVPPDAQLTVTTAMDDEAFNLGLQIYEWLHANGRPQTKGVNSAIWTRPIFGIELGNKGDNSYELRVGIRG